MDNLSTGFRKLIHKKARFFKLDILNKKKINNLIKKYKIDSIIHLAANLIIGEGQKNLTNIIRTMLRELKEFLQLVKIPMLKILFFLLQPQFTKKGSIKLLKIL